MIFGPKIGQNHSGAEAPGSKKITKKAALRLCWCFPVFEGASGHVFGRFSEGFGMDFPSFSERFRDTFFARKLAVDRLTHLQKSFSGLIFRTPLA